MKFKDYVTGKKSNMTGGNTKKAATARQVLH